jgi:hypothetical protein
MDGSYNVYITDSIGCSRLGNGITFTEVNEAGNNGVISFYPNPAKNQFTVYGLQFIPQGGRTKLKMFNVLGEMVYQSEITNPTSEINVAGLAKGVYVVELKSGERVFLTKFVKQ